MNIVSLNYTEYTNPLHHRSNAYKRREETLKGKNTLALEMLNRALDNGIDADYLLVDSWYAKPNFIKEAVALGIPVIARIVNNERIWNFKGKHKTLGSIYNALSKVRHCAHGRYGKIRYTYFGAVAEHKELGRVKLVFLHTGKDLIVFISTDLALSAGDIITTYRKRWNIEQGYKDLREHFRELECELEALVISMQLFIQILSNIADIENIVKENKDLLHIIAVLRVYTRKELGFMCEN